MPETAHDNTNAEQACATLHVISNDVTTRSREDSDAPNQGSYTDIVGCLNKVVTRFNKVVIGTRNLTARKVRFLIRKGKKIVNDHEINLSVTLRNDFDGHGFS